MAAVILPSPRAAGRRIVDALRHAPGTLLYAALLGLTSLVLEVVDADKAEAVLRAQSTNLHNMVTHPVRMLLASAFWLEDANWVKWLVLFMVVMVPVERWLGTRRWLVLFVTGHVVATLATVAGISLATNGATSPASANVIDVGVSYGFYAVAAALVLRLPRPWRWVAGLALITDLVWVARTGATFTDVGHLVAVGVGFSIVPLLMPGPSASDGRPNDDRGAHGRAPGVALGVGETDLAP